MGPVTQVCAIAGVCVSPLWLHIGDIIGKDASECAAGVSGQPVTLPSQVPRSAHRIECFKGWGEEEAMRQCLALAEGHNLCLPGGHSTKSRQIAGLHRGKIYS